MKELTAVSEEKWFQFIERFSWCNIFHTPYMKKAFESTGEYEAYPLFVGESEEIFAFALFILVRIKGLRLKFTSRLISYASPLYENSERGRRALEFLLKRAEQLTRQKALFAEFRHSEQQAEHYREWEYLPYQNYLIDLSVGEKVLWEGFSSNLRNMIRSAEKKGIEIRELIMEEEYLQGVKILEKLYKEKSIPFLGTEFFVQTKACLPKGSNFRAVGAFLEGKMVGTRISLNYKNTVYDWYGTAERELMRYRINEAMVWNILSWGIKNSYLLFDFGGGAVKGKYYGPAVFKEKFHCRLVEYGRHRFIANAPLYKILSWAYELKKRD